MIITNKIVTKPELHIEANSFIIDIETTGFSPKYAAIYMIGIVTPSEDGFTVEQWFCEKESDEYELLFRFNILLEDNPILYHYNGDGFDMPFIKKRMALYGLECNTYTSKDLLKIARPYKKSLGLDNLKLKTIEAYFGYDREDPFTGGDLIEVYKRFLQEGDERLMQTVMLHNYEDLIGLMDVLTQIPLFMMLASFRDKSFSPDLTSSSIDQGIYKGDFQVPTVYNCTIEHSIYTLELNNGNASICIPIVIEDLYYFFPDYKNYVYLVNEDYAVHKSIGKFVAKDHRSNATKETAYVRKEGIYLPAHKRYDLPLPLYYRDTKQKKAYVSVEELVEVGGMEMYIQALLSEI